MSLTLRVLAACSCIALSSLLATPAVAQTCWAYTDTEPAKAPIECVRQGDLSTSCSWNSGGSSCHLDGDTSDCCVSVPSATAQTVREMHTAWHQCFGNTGNADGNNPVGRSQRWYAFHRQFEIDFNQWRDPIPGLFPIESLDWHTDMLLPVGHGGAGLDPGDHPANCGIGAGRPDAQTCPGCQAFPQCMFATGGGPIADPTAPSAVCGTPNFSLPYDSIDDFADVEEIADVLDGHFHGVMHGAIVTPPGVNGDSFSSVCSPRDPMFWRLHKALDDVVRGWQDTKAVDVVLVVDTSASMSDADATGITKLDAAINAVDLFADLLEETRDDGQQNRIGIVTYSNSAMASLPMTPVTPQLRAPGGAFRIALDDMAASGPGGCTGIGSGLEEALTLLCPPGDCRGFASPTDNDRKAIVLLTDGLENRPSCLNPVSTTSGPTCGTQCFGPPFDFERLHTAQVVSVGFGGSSSLNAPLLTVLSERQGGVYLQNPNAVGDDLKQFYVKAFGAISGEGVAIDPKGVLEASSPFAPAAEYSSCSDSSITFSSGWDKEVMPGELRLLITAPNGDLVIGGEDVEASSERLWANARVRIPFGDNEVGTWRAELVRPHEVFVNGFSPSAFDDVESGAALVRRQVQRLCPERCMTVLHYESPPQGNSIYELALELEANSGLLGEITRVDDEDTFAQALEERPWDLIVHAESGQDRRRSADELFARLLCDGQRAIYSDARRDASAELYRCAGARHAGTVQWTAIDEGGGLLDEPLKLLEPGNPSHSWALEASDPRKKLLGGIGGSESAVVAKTRDGTEQRWFADVLARGLSKLSPVSMKESWSTDDAILLAARILPSYVRAGGYDAVDAWVEVEYPTVGIGTLAVENPTDSLDIGDEEVSGIAATLSRVTIPTKTLRVRLNDDGVDGDQVANNAHWTGELRGIPIVDGEYSLRFTFDFAADGCVTRREANQSIFVRTGVDPDRSEIDVGAGRSAPDGRRRIDIRMTPMDRFGNLLGPGDLRGATCEPASSCSVEGGAPDYIGDGAYRLTLSADSALTSMRVNVFDTDFFVSVPCSNCPALDRFALSERIATEHAKLEGTVRLDEARGDRSEGVTVLLESSDPRLAPVPNHVIVPPGKADVTFPVPIAHLLDGKRKQIRIRARYADREMDAALTVLPDGPAARRALEAPISSGHDHRPPPVDYPPVEKD